MKTKILPLFISVISSFSALANDSIKAETTALETTLQAIQNNDLKKFHSVWHESMKKQITEDVLEKFSKELTPKMKQGYDKTYMGYLDKGHFKAYFWKINFDSPEFLDMLAEISIVEGKVLGFFIK